MIRIANIALPLEHTEEELSRAVAERLAVPPGQVLAVRVVRRSVDARQKSRVSFIYTVDAEVSNPAPVLARAGTSPDVCPAPEQAYTFAPEAPSPGAARPVVVGAGPCGLFAALLLAQWGRKPLLLERGRPARERVRDVTRFWRDGCLNPESNALFGEGGAGTFSDGKLTTQIKDPSRRCRKVLEELVRAGAPEEILFVHKPHIGTDRLRPVVERMRNSILELGGEVRFECRVDNLRVEEGRLRGVELASGEFIPAGAVVLAIGHSARDTFSMLERLGVMMAPKSFSIGVRVEHPQSCVDQAQYGRFACHPKLGAAEYKLVHHCAGGRTVYTFCMCPGGQVIAASSEPGGIVTNGMSAYRRACANANSALLVGVQPEDYGGIGPLAGVAFQRRWEQLAYELGGGNYHAPAQTVVDFLAGRASTGFGEVTPSYLPGVTPADLTHCLPDYAVAALREALPALGKKLRGFDRPEATLTGVETRSSSPVRILRDESGQSPGLPGLFPAGEGAGYAGGIMSAAVDGIRAAESVCQTEAAR